MSMDKFAISIEEVNIDARIQNLMIRSQKLNLDLTFLFLKFHVLIYKFLLQPYLTSLTSFQEAFHKISYRDHYANKNRTLNYHNAL
jgi:hypothetical protein